MFGKCSTPSAFWTHSVALCQYHPDRPGVGVCMRCRAVICASCCTRVDGVNHCHACLKKLGRKTEARPLDRTPLALLAASVLGLMVLVFCGIGWLVQGILAP